MQENELGNQKDTLYEWSIISRKIIMNGQVEVKYSHLPCAALGRVERTCNHWGDKLYYCSSCRVEVPKIVQFQINLLLAK